MEGTILGAENTLMNKVDKCFLTFRLYNSVSLSETLSRLEGKNGILFWID